MKFQSDENMCTQNWPWALVKGAVNFRQEFVGVGFGKSFTMWLLYIYGLMALEMYNWYRTKLYDVKIDEDCCIY